MKLPISQKGLFKRVKYLLNTCNISLEFARELKWRQLYRLLKKAAKIEKKLDLKKKELKEISKSIVNWSFSKIAIEIAAGIFGLKKIEIKNRQVNNEYVPFEKVFIDKFLDKYPLLLI